MEENSGMNDIVAEENLGIKEETNAEFLAMAPGALETLKEIIEDEGVNPGARVAAIELVLDRALGKPEENIRIQNDQEKREAVQKRLNELFLMVREKTNLPT